MREKYLFRRYLLTIIFFFFLIFMHHVETEPFGGSMNQTHKNAHDENKNKHISYNANTVFNNKDYSVRLWWPINSDVNEKIKLLP